VTPPCIVAAHGSTDQGYALVVESLAAQVAAARPTLEVRVGYLDHGPPYLADVAEPGSVVVPLLLSSGFHVRSDIPKQAPDCTVTAAVGPDRRIVEVLIARLKEAGWEREQPLTLAAAGSADPRALADVHQMARDLGDEVGRSVEPAFASAGEPRLADLRPVAVASYLLAPGVFATAVARCGAQVIAAPLGDHPLIAWIILDRYGRTAPM
jgi:sirohydrochlorin ferrochelatase